MKLQSACNGMLPVIRAGLSASLCAVLVSCAFGPMPDQEAGRVGVAFGTHGTLSRPFPSDLFTVPDSEQLTGQRVRLPRPDCAQQPDDCADIDLLDRLDGFSLNPTATVPFDGAIDPSTANSRTIFFAEIDDRTGAPRARHRVGIDRVIWNPARRILSFKPGEQLREHTRYALVVTTGVRAANGRAVRPMDRQTMAGDDRYRAALTAAQATLGDAAREVAALSVFTTMSATADFGKIRRQMGAMPMPRVDFLIADVGGRRERAVFDAAAITQVSEVSQNSVKPTFAPAKVDVAQLSLVTGSTARVAFGRYASPNYQDAQRVIPDLPSRTGEPVAHGTHDITFVLFVPAGPMPPRGWPVAIFGHGYSDTNVQAAWGWGSVLPSMGVAVIGINAVGHGGGPLTHIDVTTRDGRTAAVAGNGRSVAMTGLPGTADGNFSRYGGFNAVGRHSLIDIRDGVRQTVVDLMQLTRAIQGGIDLEGNGRPSLDADRIYYAGASLGGVYGTVFTAVEPRVRAAELFVTGGPWNDLVRQGGIHDRPPQGWGLMLSGRKPALTNLPGTPAVRYDENIPSRFAAPKVDVVPGAFELQQWFDRYEWIGSKANPVVYAPRVGPSRPVALMLARGDLTVHNEVSDVLIHAGGWRPRTAMFRYDLLRAAQPQLPADPHRWQTGAVPGTQAHQILAQRQTGAFFASDGAQFIDPDGADPVFEAPAARLPFDGRR